MDLGLSVAQESVCEAYVCVQIFVDDMPSQAQEADAIMCRARLPRKSAHFGRMRMHDGSSWLSLYGDDHEGLFQRLHGAACGRHEHVRACVTEHYV